MNKNFPRFAALVRSNCLAAFLRHNPAKTGIVRMVAPPNEITDFHRFAPRWKGLLDSFLAANCPWTSV
jgi:hypothetical protein